MGDVTEFKCRIKLYEKKSKNKIYNSKLTYPNHSM